MLETLFQNPSQQVLTKYNPQICKINEIGKLFANFTDLELKEKATEFQQRSHNFVEVQAIENNAKQSRCDPTSECALSFFHPDDSSSSTT